MGDKTGETGGVNYIFTGEQEWANKMESSRVAVEKVSEGLSVREILRFFKPPTQSKPDIKTE